MDNSSGGNISHPNNPMNHYNRKHVYNCNKHVIRKLVKNSENGEGDK